MTVMPIGKAAYDPGSPVETPESVSMNWVGYAAGGTLVAAGLLLLAGERRAGVVAAAAGTALAMLDQPKTPLSWWDRLPGYIDQAQRIVGQIQSVVDEIESKREALRRAIAR